MSAKTISHCQGKGSITHNNRNFTFKNVDPSRTAENITYAKQSLGEAYQECFGEALQRFNAKQTRADRHIDDYYAHLFGNSQQTTVATSANKQKSFYETLVQVGTKDDSGVGSSDGALAAKCLDEYMRGFSERNPNFHVFNAVLHMDEATPHLHIDYVPVAHYKRGLDTQNGIAQALKEMGYGSGKEAINRWRLAERKILEGICRENGVEIAEPQKTRGHSFTPDEYKDYKDKVAELQDEIGFYEETINTVTSLIQEQQDTLSELEAVKGETQEEVSVLRKNAVEAHRAVETAKDELNHLEDKQEGLKRDIATLETKKETLTAEEVAEMKGTKTITGGLKGVTFKDYQALRATAADNHEWCKIANLAAHETTKAKAVSNVLKQENQAILSILQKHFPQAHKLITDVLEKRRKGQSENAAPPVQVKSFEDIAKDIKALKAQSTSEIPRPMYPKSGRDGR